MRRSLGGPQIDMTLGHTIPYNPTLRAILFFVGLALLSFASGALSLFRPRVSVFALSVFLLIAILLLLRRFVWRRELALGSTEIIVPSGFLRLRPVSIPYEHINAVWVHRVLGTSVICVTTANRKVEIQDIYLPDSATFHNLKQCLESAVQSSRRTD